MKGVLALAAPLVLVACQAREVVSICAAVGDVTATATGAYHDSDGLIALLTSDADTQEAMLQTASVETPILPELWRMAEPTMRALPEVEASPCGFETEALVSVAFADGSTITRHISCTGNALARVASEVLEATIIEATHDETCLLYTSPSPRDRTRSRMPSSA